MTEFTNAMAGAGHSIDKQKQKERNMAYAIAIVVFLVLPAVAVAARVAARRRHGAHGRLDVESGHTRDFRPAQGLVHVNHPMMRVGGDPTGSKARRRGTLRPVFHIGATPEPEHVSPWASDEAIRREFDRDSSDGHGRAA